MEIGVGLLLGVVFCYINYKIIQSDFLYKRIPNVYLKMLLLLLIFWYAYAGYFGYFVEIESYIFLIQILFVFFISFSLFSFKLWGAGDAKYLLVLGLYIPHIGFFTFLGNLGLTTLFYLFVYLVWFWFGPNLWVENLRDNVYGELWRDMKHIRNIKKRAILEQSWLSLLTGSVYFLGAFISIRLIRNHIINSIKEDDHFLYYISIFLEKYTIIPVIVAIGCIFLIQVGLRNIYYNLGSKKLGLKDQHSKIYLLFIILCFLIVFIGYEYYKNSEEIQGELIRILTLSIILFFMFKIVIYLYKLYFKKSHIYKKSISKITQGDMIDYTTLLKKWGKEKRLGFIDKDLRDKNERIGILSPDPKVFFRSLRGGIQKKQIPILKKVYKEMGETQVDIQKIFPFGVFIFGGFIVTIIFQHHIITFLTSHVIHIIRGV